jgi:LacI family transcriptional regulator
MLSSDIDDPLLPTLLKEGYPLILIGRHPFFDEAAWVDSDNRAGARRATAHLIGLGHRRVATIAGSPRMAVALDRRDGYKQALLEAGLPIAPELIVEGDFTQESGERGMARLLELPDRPTAVFVAGDTMAFGALRAIQRAGLRVPDDIAIVGFDDLPLAVLTHPTLTTVRQPIRELGVAAANLLLDRLEGRATPLQHLRLSVELVVRQSCGAQSAPTAEQGGPEPPHS